MIRQINNCAAACCAIQMHFPTMKSSAVIVQQTVGQFTRIRSVAEYAIEQALPTTRQHKLPSIEQIERELARELNQGESEQ